MEIKILPDEAGKIAQYLLDCAPQDEDRALYASFVRMKDIFLTEKECRLWSLMLANKFVFYFFDSGLAACFPQSAIRRRILCMLGVMETQPHLASRFLASKTSQLLFFTDAAKVLLTVPLMALSEWILKIYFR